MLQHRQDIPLEKCIWTNMNLGPINMSTDFGWQGLIDIDLMSHL